MANKYASQAISGYNSSPPPDDGSTVASNTATWAGLKGKLADPIKNQAAGIDSAVLTAFGQQFGYSIESVSTDFSLGSGDTNKFILATGTHTLTLPAAAAAGTSSLYAIKNNGTGTTAVAPNGTELIDGSNTALSLAAGEWAFIATDGAAWNSFRISIPTLVNLGNKNRFHNGACGVAQRTIAPNLSTSFQYGKVDRFMVAATGGAVSAGTITQDTAASVGRTGNALKAAGVTLTGSGVISAKQRIESKDAALLKNQNASFSVRVFHDVGSNINYTVTIKKPTATDNYTSTTTIATSSATSVATGTDTQITFANQALGDCSAGLEIQVDAACGAVTTKNFSFTEWQIEEGAAVTNFEYRSYVQELQTCMRFAELLTDVNGYGSDPFTGAGGGFSVWFPFSTKKRVAATVSLTGTASLSATGGASGATLGSGTTTGVTINCTGASQSSFAVSISPGTGGLLATADL